MHHSAVESEAQWCCDAWWQSVSQQGSVCFCSLTSRTVPSSGWCKNTIKNHCQYTQTAASLDCFKWAKVFAFLSLYFHSILVDNISEKLSDFIILMPQLSGINKYPKRVPCQSCLQNMRLKPRMVKGIKWNALCHIMLWKNAFLRSFGHRDMYKLTIWRKL